MDRTTYLRLALWSAVVALGAPIFYFVVGLTLESVGSKESALLFAWLLVLPMFFAVAIGSLCTIVFILLAILAKPVPEIRSGKSDLPAEKS